MKEYKLLKQKMGWSKNLQKFEDELNNYALKGWSVVNIFINHEVMTAVLEKDKNR
jgi:hypothetical protein